MADRALMLKEPSTVPEFRGRLSKNPPPPGTQSRWASGGMGEGHCPSRPRFLPGIAWAVPTSMGRSTEPPDRAGSVSGGDSGSAPWGWARAVVTVR
jgi:hypothetical protein